MRVFRKLKTARKFTIELRNHQGIIRRFSGLTDKRQTEQLGRRIEALVEARSAKGPLDLETSRWLEKASVAMKARLVDVGLLDNVRAAAGKPIMAHVDDSEQSLRNAGTTSKHADTVAGRVRRVLGECRFTMWVDVTATAVQNSLASMQSPRARRPSRCRRRHGITTSGPASSSPAG